jgi:hypothetical protein
MMLGWGRWVALPAIGCLLMPDSPAAGSLNCSD